MLASSAIVAQLPLEDDPTIEVASFSHETPGAPIPGRWEPYVVMPWTSLTQYRLVGTDEGTALEANAEESASGLYRRIHIDAARHPFVEWSWNVVQPVRGADLDVPALADSPARLVISFHGDVNRLDIGERVTARLYKALSGQALPYAMLMYVWSSAQPMETVLSHEYTAKIQMIVVDGAQARVGQWVRFRRNVLEDYRRAFGEDPWDIVAVGVMTDSNHTSQKARCLYGDITFRRSQ